MSETYTTKAAVDEFKHELKAKAGELLKQSNGGFLVVTIPDFERCPIPSVINGAELGANDLEGYIALLEGELDRAKACRSVQ